MSIAKAFFEVADQQKDKIAQMYKVCNGYAHVTYGELKKQCFKACFLFKVNQC